MSLPPRPPLPPLPLAAGLLTDAARLAIWLVLLVAVFVPLEQLFGERPVRVWRKQTGVDLCWYFINSLLPAAILSLPLALLARAVQDGDPLGLYAAVAAWPFWVRVILVLFVADVGSYWGHRALHAHPRLWRLHAVHHSAETMDFLVNTRAHPLDTVLVKFAGLLPVYLLGLAPTNGTRPDPAVALLFVFGTLWTFFIHANVRVRLGPLEWLISTPAHHHWHHTRDDHRDHNFCFVFPVIDWVFRTVWLPKHWPASYGTHMPVPPTVLGQLLSPLGAAGGVGAKLPPGPTASSAASRPMPGLSPPSPGPA